MAEDLYAFPADEVERIRRSVRFTEGREPSEENQQHDQVYTAARWFWGELLEPLDKAIDPQDQPAYARFRLFRSRGYLEADQARIEGQQPSRMRLRLADNQEWCINRSTIFSAPARSRGWFIRNGYGEWTMLDYSAICPALNLFQLEQPGATDGEAVYEVTLSNPEFDASIDESEDNPQTYTEQITIPYNATATNVINALYELKHPKTDVPLITRSLNGANVTVVTAKGGPANIKTVTIETPSSVLLDVTPVLNGTNLVNGFPYIRPLIGGHGDHAEGAMLPA